MLKLIVGVKGSGKTKNLVNQVNEAVEKSTGSVICIEKGIKLRYDVNSRCRLINVDEYYVHNAQSLYGFIAGILASNHDISDVFVDSALRICKNNIDAYEAFINNVDELADRYGINVVMTSSVAAEALPEVLAKYL